MFNHLLKMSKEKKIRVRFKIVDGKIHVKNLNVTPDEYKKIAEAINSVIDRDVLHNHNFNASISVSI